MSFARAFDLLIGKEGGFANHKADRGGQTMFGVTERVARANGYKGAMVDLPLSTAREIAKTQYWDILNLDRVSDIAPSVAFEMFDTVYNGGEPGQWLQRALNAFNREQLDYPDVTVDGRIGPMTVTALKAFIAKRGAEGEAVLVRALNVLQGERFIRIAENNPSQEAFAYGWLRERVA
jgi:lysozyme family protein